MGIKNYELKKIITSKIMWSLIGLFLLYNIFNIFSVSNIRKDLGYFNGIIDEVGYKINDDMKERFKNYCDKNFDDVKEMLKFKTQKNYNSKEEVFQDMEEISINGEFTIKEENIIEKWNFIEGYYTNIFQYEKEYSDINMEDMAEKMAKTYNLSGSAMEVAESIEEDSKNRLNEIKESSEQETLFFKGMHGLLYDRTISPIIYQITIIIVLMTAYMFNYEFENKTHLITYTSKRGRNLTVDKLFASIVSTIIVTTIMLGISLLVFFIVFDCSRLWKVPIGSYFNWEANIPNIPWFNVDFSTYLIIIIIYIYISMIILNCIVFIISNLIRNTYIDFFIFLIISGIAINLPNIVPGGSKAIFLSVYSIFIFLSGIGSRGLIAGDLTGSRNYDLTTLSVWIILMILSIFIFIKVFKSKDIKN